MQISFDPNNLTDLDRSVLATVLGVTPTSAPPKAKAAPKVVAEVPTSEEVGTTGEELIAPADPASPVEDGPTLSDAVAAATKLVSSGQAAKVKAALADLGAPKVSGLEKDQIATFLDALGM